jgi:competence protein ComEC
MITLFEAARIGRRGTPPLWILAATALIHCLADPYSLFNAGAQLSYLAVAGIFIWNPVFNPMLSGFNRAVRYFGGSLTLSLAAQSLTLPLLLFWFGWFPLYFLLGNLVLLPLMVFGFYFGLGITIFSFTGITFLPACKAMDLLVAAVTAGSRWLGNLPGNLVRPEGLIWPDLVLYYLIFFTLRAYLDKPLPGRIRNLLLLTGMLLICRILLKIA